MLVNVCHIQFNCALFVNPKPCDTMLVVSRNVSLDLVNFDLLYSLPLILSPVCLSELN